MIRIASFNVKNLNLGKDEDSGKKRDLKRMVDLIRDYDIVVMQEVLNSKIIEGFFGRRKSSPILSHLNDSNDSWEAKWVDPRAHAKSYEYIGGDKRGEGYGFLWNKKRVDLLSDGKGKILPKVFDNYSVSPDQLRMARDPGYGRFKVNNRPIEIRVITTHIIFGKPRNDSILTELDIGAITMRKNEFDILAGKIYKEVDEYRLDDHFNAVYTVIMGDYNLNLKGGEISTAVMREVRCFDSSGKPCDDGFYTMRTIQSDLTTIKKDCSGYASNYDHCSYRMNSKYSQVIGNCFRVPDAINDTDSVEMIKKYRDEVSDHVPIVLELNL